MGQLIISFTLRSVDGLERISPIDGAISAIYDEQFGKNSPLPVRNVCSKQCVHRGSRIFQLQKVVWLLQLLVEPQISHCHRLIGVAFVNQPIVQQFATAISGLVVGNTVALKKNATHSAQLIDKCCCWTFCFVPK